MSFDCSNRSADARVAPSSELIMEMESMFAGKKIPADTISKIIRLRESGMSVRGVARVCECSVGAVHAILKGAGMTEKWNVTLRDGDKEIIIEELEKVLQSLRGKNAISERARKIMDVLTFLNSPV